MDEPCRAESALVEAQPDLKVSGSLFVRLLILLAGGAFISSTDLCFERLNANYIHKHGVLSAWYVVANLYSTLFGFYTEVLLPWQLDLRVPRLAVVSLGIWCILWDNGCRLVWYFLERAARAAGRAPSRLAMITWAMGNDVNSLLLVPLACTYLASMGPEALGERAEQDGWRWGMDPMVLTCAVLGFAMILLDAWIFQVVEDVWWAHIARLCVCLPLLLLARRFRSRSGRSYGIILLYNLFFDWTWATLRLVEGLLIPGRDFRLLRAVLYQSVFEIFSRTLKACVDGRSVEDAIVLRFIFVSFNEYFLTMLLLESTTPNLQFVGILVLKLCQKSYKTHPGCRSLINSAWLALGDWLKLPRCMQAYTAVFGYVHTEVKDKTLLLSHFSSLICCFCLVAALATDFLFDTGPRFVPGRGAKREEVGLLLLLVFLSEAVMLGFHARFAWLSAVLVPSWSRDLPRWKPDIAWWAAFLTPWRQMVWLASLGLCIARSHEELLKRLSSRSDVPG